MEPFGTSRGKSKKPPAYESGQLIELKETKEAKEAKPLVE